MTFQQQLLLQQKQTTLAMVADARTNIDNRANALLQSGILLLLLVSAIKLPAFVQQPSPLVSVALALAFLTFAGMVAANLLALAPRPFPTPTADNWDAIHTKYLQADEETCYNQVLSDTIAAIDMMEAINKRKALYLKASMVLFVLQLVGLLGLALTA